jgi:3-oxoacyl-[acyl-carrier protein] reductase
MNTNKSKKIMLITGTRKGIGRYLAEYYVEQGYLVVGCSREKSSYEDKYYRHYCLDVSDEKLVKPLFQEIKRLYGHLDVLINNAGIASMNHSLLTPISTVRKILETNVVGNFLFSREAAKLMKVNHFGRIVNIVTFAVPLKLEGEAIYAASKAAVVTLTEILSKEYAPYNITVNAVAPPAVKTDLIHGVPEDKMIKLLNRQSIHRYGTPKEICEIIDLFVKPESEMINGQIIYMGGI